jgi:glycogen debranching enzyme
MRMSGLAREAEKVARGILEAGMQFPDRRLPELWCGTERVPGELPDDYRSSCSPQNWAAASVFSLLSTMLGLHADAARGRLQIDPVPTPLFSRIEVTGLHFAGHRIDFVVDGDSVQVGDLPAGVKIVSPKVPA